MVDVGEIEEKLSVGNVALEEVGEAVWIEE